jgi:hypothetical protein
MNRDLDKKITQINDLKNKIDNLKELIKINEKGPQTQNIIT